MTEKIRAAVMAEQIPHQGFRVNGRVSLSLGLATYKGQFKSTAELMEATDNTLYRSKERGRNRVESC